MGRKVLINVPVAPGAKYAPTVRVEFRGADQIPFFGFRKIARERYEIDATKLARLLILDFVREYKEYAQNPRAVRIEQLAMALKPEPAEPEAKGAKPRKGKVK